jgi:hypothetical protein
LSEEINLNQEKEKDKNNYDFNIQSQIIEKEIKNSNRIKGKSLYKDSRTSLTARLNQNDLLVFNQRLKIFGFDTLNEMVHDFIKGKFPIVTEDKPIDNLFQNQQTGGLRSLLEGGSNREFS